MKVGDRIKSLREENGITQKEFSDILMVSPSAIGMWEQNRREPDIEMQIKIADYFNVSIDYLIGKTDTRNVVYANKNKELKFNLSTAIYEILIEKGIIKEGQDINDEKRLEIESLFSAAIDIYNLRRSKDK